MRFIKLAPVLAAALVWTGGCASSAAQPSLRSVGTGTGTYYVVSHGRHTGVAVQRADLVAALPGLSRDFGEGRWLELGWGDEAFYRDPDAGLGLALRAVLVPTKSVVHVVALKKDPPLAFPKAELVRVEVSAHGYDELVEYLAASFATSKAGQPVNLGPGLYGASRFYAARGQFHATNTCNTWSARAVAASGYSLEDVTVVTA
ncbi:MAG: DUF2459 domain-containing protein, partial [Gammaproteobacteria bacterium]